MEAEVDKVMQWAEFNKKLPHWKVYNAAQKSVIHATSDIYLNDPKTDAIDPDFSLVELRKALGMLPSGNYLLHMKGGGKDNTGIVQLPFVITGSAVAVGTQLQPQQGQPWGFPKDTMHISTVAELMTSMRAEMAANNANTLLQYQLAEANRKLLEKGEKVEKIFGMTPDLFLASINGTIGAINAARLGLPIPKLEIGIAGGTAAAVPSLTEQKATQTGTVDEVKLQQLLMPEYEKLMEVFFNEEGSVSNGIITLMCMLKWRASSDDNRNTFNAMKPMYLDKFKSEIDALKTVSGNS